MLLTLLLTAAVAASQAAPAPATTPKKLIAPAPNPGLEKLKLIAESSAKADPVLRLNILNEVAGQLCKKGQKADCKKLLEDVLASSSSSSDDNEDSSPWLWDARFDALQLLSDIDLDRAVELSEQERWSSTLLGSLAGRLATHKQYDRALELLRSAGSSRFSFTAALQVARTLPKEDGDHRFFELFTMAREAFYGAPELRMQPGNSFDLFLVDFQDRIPPDLLVSTMLDVLARIHAREQDHPRPMTISGKSETATFDTAYEFIAFEFMPVIRRFDPAKAEALERDSTQLAALNQQFPQGIDSLMPRKENSFQRQRKYISYGIDRQWEHRRVLREQALSDFERRSEKLLRDDPKQAIAASSVLDNENRLRFLAHLIRDYAAKQPSIEHDAADAILEITKAEEDPLRWERRLQVVELLGKAQDRELAAKVLRESLPELSKAYEWDDAPSDPNQEPKTVWLSTYLSVQSLFLAAQYAPNLVPRVVASAPDDDIRLLLRLYATEFEYHLRAPTDGPDIGNTISEKRNQPGERLQGTLEPMF